MPIPSPRNNLVTRVLGLALLAVIVLLCARTATVYRSSYRLSDYIQNIAIRASADETPADRLQAQIVDYAAHLGLSLTPAEIRIATHPGAVSIKLDYTVPVNLRLFTWNLRFTPWVESRAY
jgi:hypothetical protein